MKLVIEHFDSPWCVPSRHVALRGGGWSSVRALQASNLWKYRCQTRWPWKQNPERAAKIGSGVLIEKRTDDGVWIPYCRLTLT